MGLSVTECVDLAALRCAAGCEQGWGRVRSNQRSTEMISSRRRATRSKKQQQEADSEQSSSSYPSHTSVTFQLICVIEVSFVLNVCLVRSVQCGCRPDSVWRCLQQSFQCRETLLTAPSKSNTVFFHLCWVARSCAVRCFSNFTKMVKQPFFENRQFSSANKVTLSNGKWVWHFGGKDLILSVEATQFHFCSTFLAAGVPCDFFVSVKIRYRKRLKNTDVTNNETNLVLADVHKCVCEQTQGQEVTSWYILCVEGLIWWSANQELHRNLHWKSCCPSNCDVLQPLRRGVCNTQENKHLLNVWY